jgi:NAD(P) transhydrogenase
MTRDRFDLVVIGSGPGGQRAAVVAAKQGKKTLVIERQLIGGSCLHTGTIPSKSLREAALNPALGGSIRAVMQRVHEVIQNESDVITHQLDRNQVEFRLGSASFVDLHHLAIGFGANREVVEAEKIVIATGTRPRRPKDVVFDEGIMFDSDTILGMGGEPKSMLVVGAGVIGCEYASIFAQTGMKVTLIDSRSDLLKFMDADIVQSLLREFKRRKLEVLLNTSYGAIEQVSGETQTDSKSEKISPFARVELLIDGKSEIREFDAVLFCQGRQGNHESLNLSSIGLSVDDRGLIPVNSNYQTARENVYAVGDIIGSPALAASSYEQGRLAAMHAVLGTPAMFSETFPFGIYTIPEISSVGPTEEELKLKNVKYVVGTALYRELARGKIIGDVNGFLKLLVHSQTRRIIGVHVIGTGATELIHIGQCAMAFGGTVDFFVDNIFNYPTLAEAYKVAAYSAINLLSGRSPRRYTQIEDVD